MYSQGQGVPQSNDEALKWYRLAADQGEAVAQSNLGAMYYHGLCVPQSYAEALSGCEKPLTRVTPSLNCVWHRCTKPVTACHKTIPRLSSGTASPPIKAMPPPSSSWASVRQRHGRAARRCDGVELVSKGR